MKTPNIPLIIDIGEKYTKIGYAGEDRPQVVIPTVVGYPKQGRKVSDKKSPVERTSKWLLCW